MNTIAGLMFVVLLYGSAILLGEAALYIWGIGITGLIVIGGAVTLKKRPDYRKQAVILGLIVVAAFGVRVLL